LFTGGKRIGGFFPIASNPVRATDPYAWRSFACLMEWLPEEGRSDAPVTPHLDTLALRVCLLDLVGRSVRDPAQQKNREHNGKKLKHEFFSCFQSTSL
jgi:hypothetical protein